MAILKSQFWKALPLERKTHFQNWRLSLFLSLSPPLSLSPSLSLSQKVVYFSIFFQIFITLKFSRSMAFRNLTNFDWQISNFSAVFSLPLICVHSSIVAIYRVSWHTLSPNLKNKNIIKKKNEIQIHPEKLYYVLSKRAFFLFCQIRICSLKIKNPMKKLRNLKKENILDYCWSRRKIESCSLLSLLIAAIIFHRAECLLNKKSENETFLTHLVRKEQ